MSKNGKSTKRAKMPSAKDVYDNVVRAFAPRLKGTETAEEAAVLLDAAVFKLCGKHVKDLPKFQKGLKAHTRLSAFECAVAVRWGYTRSSLRAFFPRPGEQEPRRRPSHNAAEFFKDLRQYGNAKFDERGKVIRESLGTGPDPMTFLSYTRAGSDGRAHAE